MVSQITRIQIQNNTSPRGLKPKCRHIVKTLSNAEAHDSAANDSDDDVEIIAVVDVSDSTNTEKQAQPTQNTNCYETVCDTVDCKINNPNIYKEQGSIKQNTVVTFEYPPQYTNSCISVLSTDDESLIQRPDKAPKRIFLVYL